MSKYDKKVQNIQNKCPRKIRDHLLGKENVHSVGIGFREKDGKLTQKVCVTVGVTDKKKTSDLDSSDIVPPILKGIHTDVQEREQNTFDTEDSPDSNPGNNDELQRKVRDDSFSVLSGGLTGNGESFATAPGSARLVDEDNEVVTLTNRHVACDEDEDCTGGDIIQPSGYEEFSDRVVGEVKNLGPFDSDGPAEDNVDVASISMDETVAEVSNRYYAIGEQLDFQNPSLGEMVVNAGRRTGFTSSRIVEVDSTTTVSFEPESISFTGVFRYDRGDIVTSGGDSGSITGYFQDNGDFAPVGLHFASGGTSIAMPFPKIQEAIGNLTVPDGDYTAPSSTVGIELLEVACYDLFYDDETEEFVVKYLVSNTGSENFTDTVELLDSDDNLISSQSYSDISPGDYTVDEFKISSSYNGEVLTLNTADHEDTLQPDEENEDDYIPTITSTNSPITENQDLVVEYDITNDSDIGEEETIEFYFGGSLEGSKSVSFSNDTISDSFTYTTTSSDIGETTVYVYATESENSDAETVMVEEQEDPFFDLTIDSTNSPVEQGDILEVSYTVENTGATGSSDITLSVDDIVKDTDSSIEVESDSNKSGVLSWQTDTNDRGDYTLTVDATDVDSSSDSDIGNVEKPATYLLNISNTNSAVKVGDVLEVDVEVQNSGDKVKEKEITFSVSDYVESRFLLVDSGETQTEIFEWQTEDGDIGEYTAQVESEDDVDSESVEVREPFPPFFEINITSLEYPVEPSSDLVIGYTVENTGEESDTQDIKLEIEESVEKIEDGVKLAGGEVYSSEFTYTVQEDEGEYSGSIYSNDDSSSFIYEVESKSSTDNFTIPQDWDDIAIDDGTITLKAPKYSYVLETFDGTQEITGQVESIRYSPKVNSAPSINIDIPPRDDVDGVTFLGGELTVYVNGDFLFNGDVVVIDTSEKEGDSSSIKARSKGKKIDGEIVDETPQNVILQDFMAKIIDKFNEYDGEAIDIAGTVDEELTNIVEVSDIIRRPDGTSGTVRYNNVGDNAFNVKIIYVKATVDDSLEISLKSGTETLYSQTITELEFGQYGTWFPIFPETSSTDSYDIEFELNGSGTILYDWISLTEDRVRREVLPFETDIIDENLVLQDASTDAEFNEVFGL